MIDDEGEKKDEDGGVSTRIWGAGFLRGARGSREEFVAGKIDRDGFAVYCFGGTVRLGHPRDKRRSTDWSRDADFMKASPSSWPCGQINQNHRSVFVPPVEDDLLSVGRNIKRAHGGQVFEPRQAPRAHGSQV
jgi:hypothetical protein